MATQKAPKLTTDKVTSALMYYFIYSLNGVLGKTHLQKLMFLSDLLASKKFNGPISKMKYVRYTHGPYSWALDDYINGLKEKEYIEQREFPITTDPRKSYSRFYLNKKVDVKTFLLTKLGAAKMLLIDEIVQSYGNKSLQEVLDIVYSLEEVKRTKHETPIQLAQKMQHSEEDMDDIPF